MRLSTAPTPPERRWPRRIARPHDARAGAARPCTIAASRGSGSRSRPKFADRAWAMITRSGRGHRDPIAVKRHLDAAVGAEAGVGLPRDVGEQARGQAQAAHRRRIVEERRDPGVEQVAVLAEAVLAAAGVARLLDQRVDAPNARLQLRIEQAFADAVGRNDELATARAHRRAVEQHRGDRRGGEARRGGCASDSRGSSVATSLRSSCARPGSIRYWWVIGSGKSVASMSIRASARHDPPTM